MRAHVVTGDLDSNLAPEKTREKNMSAKHVNYLIGQRIKIDYRCKQQKTVTYTSRSTENMYTTVTLLPFNGQQASYTIFGLFIIFLTTEEE